MLILGESVNQHKRFILDCIATSRQLIRTLSKHVGGDLKDVAYSIIEQEQSYIKNQMAYLIKLKRWAKQEGIDPDWPYQPPSMRKGNRDAEG